VPDTARRRGLGTDLPRNLGALHAGEADGGSSEGAPAYLEEERATVAPEPTDPTTEPRRAHSKPVMTTSLSNPHATAPEKTYMARGPITGAYMHATHPAERRRLASGLLRLPKNSK